MQSVKVVWDHARLFKQNKNVIIFNTITMFDSEGLVEGWASIGCDPKVAGLSLNIFFLNYYIGKIKSNSSGKVKHWVSRAISLISWIKSKPFTGMGKLNVQSVLYICTLDMTDKVSSKLLTSKASVSNSDWFFL